MLSEVISDTTTFWRQDAFVQDVNQELFCEPEETDLKVMRGREKVGEFLFGRNFDFSQDTPTWQAQIDAQTGTFKYRLDIQNVWAGGHGAQAPRDIQVRPAGYDKSWKLAWRYTENKSKYSVLPSIEIFRVDGENDVEYKTYYLPKMKDGFEALWLTDAPEHVVYTLKPADFRPYEVQALQWLRNHEPIDIHKHDTYITIRASAHLARSWSTIQSYGDRPPKFFREHVMSDDEAAWISRDNYIVKRKLDALDAQHAGPAGMHAMLGALEQLAA
jgi:hypothetical protein